MGIFFRSFRALLWKNFLYRRRRPFASTCEFFLPILVVGLLILIKNPAEDSVFIKPQIIPANFPTSDDTITPLSFTDYITALQAQRVCLAGKGRRGKISGITNNWAVPFVHCDQRLCPFRDADGIPYCEYRSLGLAPINEHTQAFADWIVSTNPALASQDSLPFNFSFIQMFNSSEDMDLYVKSDDYGTSENPKIGAAIVINSGKPSYSYTIRVNSTNFNLPHREARPAALTTPPTTRHFDTFAKTPGVVCMADPGSPQLGDNGDTCTGKYVYNGAITLQRLVDDWIINDTGAEALGNKVAENGVSFVTFPTEEYTIDGFYSIIATFIPLLIVLGLMYPVLNMIRMIVVEKELRQKELMKMMSVTEATIEWSWFISYIIFFGPCAIGIAIVCDKLFDNSELSVLIIFWLLVMAAIVSYCMFMASVFSRASRAGIIGLLAFFSGYFGSTRVDINSARIIHISYSALHPICAMSFGLQMIGSLENEGSGMTWDNISFSDNFSGYSFETTLQNLFFDIFFWWLVSWYLNRVRKGTYGRAYPLWFPITKSYWFGGSKGTSTEEEEAESMLEGDTQSVMMEPVSDALKEQELDGRCVEIRNLSKTFGEKNAVDGLNLSMYSGQVTALLGHNGAGKTTTINMLTGMIEPTSGYAIVGGRDIRTQMPEIREGVGICLQHDCLFPLLTVREHVQFFAQIKGLYATKTRKEAEESIETSIKDVALYEKSDTFSKNLSGGMKRKLSVAIAFCGDSKVVFLDEPTSGMDPFSRRFTWNVIRQYRQDRCIILTTHFMDEADLLGDRIAIMAEGRLRCVGSSLFLKKSYGVGYQLTIEKNSYAKTGMEGGLLEADNVYEPIENTLKQLVASSVSDSKELNNVGTEISFQLPLNASDQFAEMFAQLDEMVSSNKIVTYGVSITTLDEVFLMVARGDSGNATAEPKIEDVNEMDVPMGISFDESDIEEISMDLDASRLDASRLDAVDVNKIYHADIDNDKNAFGRHVQALFVKRAKNFQRDKRAWFCSVVLPSLFALAGFSFMTFGTPDKNLPPTTLTLEDYNVKVQNQNERHPISYNSAGLFTCNPGTCIDQDTIFSIAQTEEKYFMCGSSASVEKSAICSTSHTESIISEISEDGVIFVKDESSTNIEMTSRQLHKNAHAFAASQYGALYFNRDRSSTIFDQSSDLNGQLYNETSVNECLDFHGLYRSQDQCSNFNGVSYVVSTNFTSLHAPILYQALADEALINEVVEDEISISATIHPLPITDIETSFSESENAFTAWFVLIFSFPFISGSFATFIVTERQSKAKHLQTVAGVKPHAYWLSSYLWDIMNYQLPLWIVVIMMHAFGIHTFITPERGVASGTLITLILFGPASAAFTYCITFLFDSPSKCNFVVICFNFLIGLAGPMTVYILNVLSLVPDLRHLALIGKRLTLILRFFPCFNLGKALFYIINIDILEFSTGKNIKTVWNEEILLNEVIVLAIECVMYFLLALSLDRWSTNPRMQRIWQFFVDTITLKFLFKRLKERPEPETNEEEEIDEDVALENQRVISGQADEDLIVVKKLTKIYGNDKLAVDKLSFGIPAGQCFGLLGINGAGKTSTMAMLTAEFPPNDGDAWLGGHSVVTRPEETRRRIGYCPQFDAHFTNMTGREHVELYASIKGIPKSSVKSAAKAKLEEVGLSESDSNKLSHKYSGGMKRKLSVACATIGQPPIVFLDEPSTGMDPVARRELWKVISRMVSSAGKDGKARTSVILTTHSMEECEALCPRIGIMANGKMKCLGSAQRLKSRFGKGFQVEIKVAEVDDTDDDYISIVRTLLQKVKPDLMIDLENSPISSLAQNITANLTTALSAVRALTNDTSISSLINLTDPSGYVIHKNATSEAGVTIDELAVFCVEELRMKTVRNFITEKYPDAVLRERQDNKARFEVNSEGLKISTLFALIEDSKTNLRFSDYGISQTTLEQVFNLHAAAAETEKQGQHDEDVGRRCFRFRRS